jgi:hypothetical protein
MVPKMSEEKLEWTIDDEIEYQRLSRKRFLVYQNKIAENEKRHCSHYEWKDGKVKLTS